MTIVTKMQKYSKIAIPKTLTKQIKIENAAFGNAHIAISTISLFE